MCLDLGAFFARAAASSSKNSVYYLLAARLLRPPDSASEESTRAAALNDAGEAFAAAAAGRYGNVGACSTGFLNFRRFSSRFSWRSNTSFERSSGGHTSARPIRAFHACTSGITTFLIFSAN